MYECMSIVKRIQSDLGGEWKYDLRTRIWSDCKGREVKKVIGCLDGYQSSTNTRPHFILYGDGEPRELIITGTPLVFNN